MSTDEQRLRKDLERLLEEMTFEEVLAENALTEVDVLTALFLAELLQLPFWITDDD